MPQKSKSIKVSDRNGNKPWLRGQVQYTYPIDTREKEKRFLVVCEGLTEKLYFESFPVLAAKVIGIHGGSSKSSLVNSVSQYLENENYNEVWCLFDMDHTPSINGQKEDFNKAIKKAKSLGYKCAYSNDAFELWFVLHYQYFDQKVLRDFYYKSLSKYWKINYEKLGKKGAFSETIYNLLLNDQKANQNLAVKNGRKLHHAQIDKPYHLQNPVTTVYLLVEELNKHLRK